MWSRSNPHHVTDSIEPATPVKFSHRRRFALCSEVPAMKLSGSSRCWAKRVPGGQSLHGLTAQSPPATKVSSGAVHWYWARLVQPLIVQQAPSVQTPWPQLVPAPSHVPPCWEQSSGPMSWQLPSVKQHAPLPASHGSSRQLVPAPAKVRPADMHEKASAWPQSWPSQHAPVEHGAFAQSSPGRKIPPRPLHSATSAAGTHCAPVKQHAPWAEAVDADTKTLRAATAAMVHRFMQLSPFPINCTIVHGRLGLYCPLSTFQGSSNAPNPRGISKRSRVVQ